MIIATAALCLAINVYHEARGEMIPGQYAVAQVALYRAGGNENRVCAEVFKPRQFSWANSGVRRTKEGWVLSKRHVPRDAHAWWVAQRVAQVTLAGAPDFTKGMANHYHATHVKPRWRLAMLRTHRIGRHIFYKA